MNVGSLTANAAVRFGGRTAVTDTNGYSATFLELEERSDNVAAHLASEYGVKRGDRVAVLLSNRGEVVEHMVGATKLGAIYTGLNFRLDVGELTNVFKNAGPVLLVTGSDQMDLAEELARQFDFGVWNVDVEMAPAASAEALVDVRRTARAVRPEDDFCIVYSSGTTGLPKGIQFNHRAVLIHAAVCCLEFEMDADTIYAVALPHNSSINITLIPCLMVGGRIHFLESRGFDPTEYYREVDRTGATHSYLVPTQIYRVLSTPPAPGQFDSIRTLGYGAAATAPDKVLELVELMGPRVVQLYGMAEIASIATMLRKNEHLETTSRERPPTSSVGRPSYMTELRIVDDEGNDVARGDRGEVIFTSPYIMKGYFRDPERTAEALRDGWIYSGDIGMIDEAGFVHIVDRKKDLIIRGGHNVASSEIEAVLYKHPDVLEAAAFGVTDEQWGEQIIAAVVLRRDASTPFDDLLAWFKSMSGLGAIKTPAEIRVIREMPKNGIGKVVKRDLREAYLGGGLH